MLDKHLSFKKKVHKFGIVQSTFSLSKYKINN